jgi:hypothetical protein
MAFGGLVASLAVALLAGLVSRLTPLKEDASLAGFYLISLSVGVSTGWDNGTFRIFFLLGAVLTVPWLALGTVYLHIGRDRGRTVQWGLVFFTGLATGVLLTAPIDGKISGTGIPVGSEVFGAFPRVLAAVGSGVGAVVIIAGALWSAYRFARSRPTPGNGRRAAANLLIALGTLVLSSGGLIQGVAGKDEAFVITLASGILVIYAGFLVAAGAGATRDASSRPATVAPIRSSA